MQASSNKIIVKVGKQSHIKFKGAKAFRAVTIDELYTIYRINPDTSIVIIENIKGSDTDKLKKFISDFESARNNNHVLFYIPDNDDVTSGVADELDRPIYLTARSLYDGIEKLYGVSYTTDLNKIAENDTINSDDPFDTYFIDTIDVIETNRKKQDDQVLPSIESKDDLNDFDLSIVNDTIGQENKNDTNGNTTNNIDNDSADKALLDKKHQDELNEAISNAKHAEDEIGRLRKELEAAINKSNGLDTLVRALEKEKRILSDRLKEFSNSEIMEEPIPLSQYKELEEKIKNLSVQMNSSDSSGATSAQLTDVLNKLKKAEEELHDNRLTIDGYKERLRTSGSKIVELGGKITEHEETITRLRDEIDNASKNEKLSAETQAELEKLRGLSTQHDKDVAHLNDQLSEVKKLAEELQIKLMKEVSARLAITDIVYSAVSEISNMEVSSASNSKLVNSLKETITSLELLNRQNSARIADYEQKMVTFSSIELTMRTLQSERDTISAENETCKAKINEYEKKLSAYSNVDITMKAIQSEKERLQNENLNQKGLISQLQGQLTTEKIRVQELESEAATVDARLEMARNFSASEVDKVKREKISIQAELNAVQQQLEVKTNQYEQLVKSCGMNENGVTSLLETSKTIEEYNKTLIEQLDTLKKKYNTAISEATIAKQTAEALEASNRTMRANMESMSSLIGGGDKPQSIRPIRYSARGMIIPVFGSGSFGITTTAVSLAHKMASQSRVLYIDFDMICPRADVCFRTPPTVKGVPGIDPTSRKSTGLGVLVEKQMQFFISNHQQIISKALQTKNGSIDYISGFYVRPDTNKLLMTDFSAFLNFLGNMYTYIIIDFGKLGASEISDQLIKAFVDASFKSIVVTTNNKVEVNMFRTKLAECKIPMSKIAWLLNMCTTTKLDDSIRSILSSTKYEMLPFKPEIYGKHIQFMSDPMTRDKMIKFINEALIDGPRKV